MKTPFTAYKQGNTTIDNFREMCKVHDLHFSQADDHREWKNGHEELKIISEAAVKLGPPARDVWNTVIRNRLPLDMVDAYLW